VSSVSSESSVLRFQALEPQRRREFHGMGTLRSASGTIYGSHMSKQKTTVYLGADDYRRLKALARDRGVGTASLVREAVAEYAVRHAPRRRPRSIGIAASVQRELGRRSEDLLKGFGRE
jgi:ribbon-helix-helix CopG family protein